MVEGEDTSHCDANNDQVTGHFKRARSPERVYHPLSGPGKAMPMPSQRIADCTTLQRLLQQTNADWEALAQSIHADQDMLEALQRRQKNLHLLLTLDPVAPAKACPALAAQIASLEQQIILLAQKLELEKARRHALEQQFDQARLALVTIRRMSQRRQGHWAAGRKLLARSIKWSLRSFWAALQASEAGAEIIPRDRPLGDHPLSPPTA
jgi:hypothetical protein